MIQKMRRLGCAESTVVVIPTGYSFNPDGTSIYMTMAAVFLAQATNTCRPGTATHIVVGGDGLPRAPAVSPARIHRAPQRSVWCRWCRSSLALLVGIDRFMSECRALVNLIGNGVATVVISRWERGSRPRREGESVSDERCRHGCREPPEVTPATLRTAESETTKAES